MMLQLGTVHSVDIRPMIEYESHDNEFSEEDESNTLTWYEDDPRIQEHVEDVHVSSLMIKPSSKCSSDEHTQLKHSACENVLCMVNQLRKLITNKKISGGEKPAKFMCPRKTCEKELKNTTSLIFTYQIFSNPYFHYVQS